MVTVVPIDHRHRSMPFDNCHRIVLIDNCHHMLNNATVDRDVGVATSVFNRRKDRPTEHWVKSPQSGDSCTDCFVPAVL